jgi:hypothetical protein
MTEMLPQPLSPSNPLGAPRKQIAGKKDPNVIDWKSAKMMHAMLAGIEAPIEDNVVGTIPAGVPLRLEQAARAVGIRLRRARKLQMEPDFCEEMRKATANYRACLAPENIAVAREIRDDKLVKPKDRIKAMEFLQGPQPGRAGTTVTIQNTSPGRVIVAGYNIDLRHPDEKIAPVIDHEPETIPAMPPSENTAGNTASDVVKEHRDELAVRTGLRFEGAINAFKEPAWRKPR